MLCARTYREGDELDGVSTAGGGGGGAGGGLEVDNKTLEKLTERSYYRDYQRLALGGLHPLPQTQSPTSISPALTAGKKTDFRISPVNSNYQVCRR